MSKIPHAIFDFYGNTWTYLVLDAILVLVLWLEVKHFLMTTLMCHSVTAEITAPTLWIKHLVYKENKQNSSTSRKQGERKKRTLALITPHIKALMTCTLASHGTFLTFNNSSHSVWYGTTSANYV